MKFSKPAVFTIVFMLLMMLCSCGSSSSSKAGGQSPSVSIEADYTSIFTNNSDLDFCPLTVMAEDEDGTIVSYEYTLLSDTSNGYIDGENTANGKFYHAGFFPGTAVIEVNVTDDSGNTASDTVTLYILDSGHVKISSTEGNFTAGLSSGDMFGYSVTGIGDIDGDGINDIAVGAPYIRDSVHYRGAVFILLLNGNGTVKSHHKIYEETGGTILFNTYALGISLANIGDIDNDGIAEIAVGAEWDVDSPTAQGGAVVILFINSDGSLRTFQKISDTSDNFTTLDTIDLFGSSITSMGDMDGDGINDIAVGAKGDDDGGSTAGAVYLINLNSDATVKTYKKISGTSNFPNGFLDAGYSFGTSLVNGGDLTGNGVNDLIVGTPGFSTRRGVLWVVLMDADGPTNQDGMYWQLPSGGESLAAELSDSVRFGTSVAIAGGAYSDTRVIAGSPYYGEGGAIWSLSLKYPLETEGVYSYQRISDFTGGFNAQLSHDDRFGQSVANIGDINGDGIDDIAVGAIGDDDGEYNSGAVWILFLDGEGKVWDPAG